MGVSERASRRVVVTGLGAVSSIGIGADAFTEGIRAGRTGFSPITSFDTTGFPTDIAGEVHDFVPAKLLENLDEAHWGRSSLLAAAAARQSVADAGLQPGQLAAARTGSIIGTTGGESVPMQQLVEQCLAGGLKGIEARLVPQAVASQIANAVNTELGLTGDAITLPTACSASNFAVGYAYDLVRTGEADFMVAGGADAVNRSTHAGFYRLGALSTEGIARPFAVNRSGIITGEGGVSLLLEPLEHAVARGARIYAEVLGYGMNCDARHMVNPDSTSIADCIRIAHASAGVEPGQIDYICAHGTGTPTNDLAEVGAVRQVFGDRLPPISSIKSMIGHSMGAASGFGALISCAAVKEGFLPPTANVVDVDPALGEGVDCVPGRARPCDVRIVQNHGFAFGGNNAITIFGRIE